MTALDYTTVATSQTNGPLVGSLTSGQASSLAYDYAFDYPRFYALAGSLINHKVQAIERGEPEGQRNQLTITGWGSTAPAAASAINTQWAKGKLRDLHGVAIAAWEEYPHEVAWAPDGDTLVLRWLKEQPQLYLLVFALIAVIGFLVYRILTTGSYTLQTATRASSSHNPIQVQPGGLTIFGVRWYWYVVGAGTLAVTPWAFKKIVEIKQDEAGSLAATRAIRKERQ